ncbi:9990_t:CDS:1 [Funneliformis mosseae]|uniref:9990_t:CDS:1 n=1 Tax=Funneliformis mosseae TaxID=27381 RepID=A0A9N8YN85_FUNMO|nr:9990_t:CDS:1 [Funneliformis mosseae]
MRDLPSLCLEKIFWAIYNEDVMDDDPINTMKYIRNSLFNCLLVNRHFCRHVIPILWRNTFNWHLPSAKLVISYLCFLSPKARSFLSQRLDIDVRGLLDYCGKKTPFFNYASYLRELEYRSVLKSVQELWPVNQNTLFKLGGVDYQLLMVEELCKMFLSQCPALIRLDLATDSKFQNHFKFTPIPLHPLANPCLCKLREFKFGKHPDQLKVINTLSKLCHNIEIIQLSIFNHHDPTLQFDWSLYEGIHRLIMSQWYLKEFICSFAQKGFLSVIGPALLTKSSTLRDVTFHECDLLENDHPFDDLIDRCNLSSLTLIDCKNLQGSHFSPLTHSIDHKSFFIKKTLPLSLNIAFNSPLQCTYIKSILPPNNLCLTRLLLNDIIQQPCSLIDHVTVYCPNLIHFRANISACILPQLPKFFKSLNKLEIIELNNEKVFYENLIPTLISNELAIEISESIPNSLYNFTFLLMAVFTSQSLSLFLERLDERCIVMSDLNYSYSYYFDEDEYVEVEMGDVIFEEFFIRVDLEEWLRINEIDNIYFKLLGNFECTRYLDDGNSRVYPTYVESDD